MFIKTMRGVVKSLECTSLPSKYKVAKAGSIKLRDGCSSRACGSWSWSWPGYSSRLWPSPRWRLPGCLPSSVVGLDLDLDPYPGLDLHGSSFFFYLVQWHRPTPLSWGRRRSCCCLPCGYWCLILPGHWCLPFLLLSPVLVRLCPNPGLWLLWHCCLPSSPFSTIHRCLQLDCLLCSAPPAPFHENSVPWKVPSRGSSASMSR